MNYSLTTSFLGSQLEEVVSRVWWQEGSAEVQQQSSGSAGCCRAAGQLQLRHSLSLHRVPRCLRELHWGHAHAFLLEGEASGRRSVSTAQVSHWLKNAITSSGTSELLKDPSLEAHTLVWQFVLPGMYIASNRVCSNSLYPLHLSSIFLRQ